MFRFLGTALAAVLLAGITMAPAAATTKAAVHRAVSAQAPEDALPVTEFHLIAPDTRVELSDQRAAEAAGSNADLKMWLGNGRSTKEGAIRRFARGIINRTSSLVARLTRNAMRFIGTPYVFGGTTSSGFDCSGYVQHIFAMQGIRVPRTADAQFYAAHKIRNGGRAGDLVFFQTYLPGPSHVGIYLGKGKFIHSSSHGVMISSLNDSYWAVRYLGMKRVVN